MAKQLCEDENDTNQSPSLVAVLTSTYQASEISEEKYCNLSV